MTVAMSAAAWDAATDDPLDVLVLLAMAECCGSRPLSVDLQVIARKTRLSLPAVASRLNRLQGSCGLPAGGVVGTCFVEDEYDDPFGAPPPFTVSAAARQMAAIVLRDEPDGVWRCRYCRIETNRMDRPGWSLDLPFAERDHVVPRSRGGSNRLSNLALACNGCNARKSSTPLDEMPDGWHLWRERERSGGAL